MLVGVSGGFWVGIRRSKWSQITLQGKHIVVEVVVGVFSVTKLEKKKPPIQPLLLIAEVLMDGPYN